MPYPIVQVQVAFDDGPYTASPTWTDITSYVRGINIQRGRDSDTANFESGNATVVLDNRDRRFDPFHATGPYFGKLLPRRQIRIRGTVSGVTYNIFRGFVSGWPVELSESGYDSTVTLSCFDLLGLLADEELPDNLAGFYIQSLGARHYWPLDDPLNPVDNATLSLVDLGTHPMPLSSPAKFIGNANGLAVGLPDTSLIIADGDLTQVFGERGDAPAAGTMSACIWYQQTQPDYSQIAFTAGLTRAIEVAYNPDPDDDVYVYIYEGGNRREYRNTAVFLDMSVPHFFAVAQAGGFTTTPRLWIDGIEITLSFVAQTSGWLTFGDEFSLLNGRYQLAAVFTSALTATQVQTIYNLSANRVLESTFDRFDRIMGYTSVPASLYTKAGSSAYTVFDIGAGGPPVTQELQLLADSEGGNLFVSSNGVLTMTSRNSIFSGSSVTSQATLGDTGITVEPILRYRFDDDSIINDLSVNYTGDGTITVQDATSISTYGQASGSVATYLSSVDQAEDLAELIVGFSDLPKIALDPFRVNVTGVLTDWQTILDLELLDRITVIIEQRTGADITTAQLIQAISHDITPGEWRTTITGSTRFTNPFILDSSLLDGPDLLI